MATVTFRLKSPYQLVQRRDFTLADTTLLNPTNANPLEMGEFLMLDSAFKVIRADGSTICYALFTEKGRSDTQAIGKVPVLKIGGYDAETLIYNASSAPALGAELEVATVTYETLSKSGLQTKSAGKVVGYVLRTAASNGGYLRFQQTMV